VAILDPFLVAAGLAVMRSAPMPGLRTSCARVNGIWSATVMETPAEVCAAEMTKIAPLVLAASPTPLCWIHCGPTLMALIGPDLIAKVKELGDASKSD